MRSKQRSWEDDRESWTTLPRVILAGAGSDVGAATMATLREHGAAVFGFGGGSSATGDVIDCDFHDRASVDDSVSEALAVLGGGVDVVINTTSTAPRHEAADWPGGDVLEAIDAELLGLWRVAVAALPALRRGRGRIVNLVSHGAGASPTSAICRDGALAYMRALRAECGDLVTMTTVDAGRTADSVVIAEALVRAGLRSRPRELMTADPGAIAALRARLFPRSNFAPRRAADVAGRPEDGRSAERVVVPRRSRMAG